MWKIRELLRLKYALGRSHGEIAASLGASNSTVSDHMRRASAAGFSWPLPEGLDDAVLEAALFPAYRSPRVTRSSCQLTNPSWWKTLGDEVTAAAQLNRLLHPYGPSIPPMIQC